MFGIGITEIIVILVIALILIGPDKLPELAKTLGKGLSEFKRAADDFRDSVKVDLDNESKQNNKKYFNNAPSDAITIDALNDNKEDTDNKEDNNKEDHHKESTEEKT
ncbi:MAG: twin-arginine translocase TatA/TatE family subunit [bacterium]